MCVGCNPKTLDIFKISVSCPLMLMLTELRNNEDDEKLVLTLGRRFFGELGYAALLVASLIEGIVRAILIIPALLVFALKPCLGPKVTEFAMDLTIRGAAFTLLAVPYACVSGLVQNIYKKTIEDEDLRPCCL